MALGPLFFLYDDVVRIECLYISSASRHFCCHFHANGILAVFGCFYFVVRIVGTLYFAACGGEKRE